MLVPVFMVCVGVLLVPLGQTSAAGVLVGGGLLVLFVLLSRGSPANAEEPVPARIFRCAGCRLPLVAGDVISLCADCGERSHQDCFDPGCRSNACRQVPAITAEQRAAPSRCPYCRDDLPGEEARGECAACLTTYHAECLAEAGCVVLGCTGRREREARA